MIGPQLSFQRLSERYLSEIFHNFSFFYPKGRFFLFWMMIIIIVANRYYEVVMLNALSILQNFGLTLDDVDL